MGCQLRTFDDTLSTHPPTLLIVGASARYAAESAARAGLACLTVDRFADWDLQRQAECCRISTLDCFNAEQILEDLPRQPEHLLITGGMENRLELLERLARAIPFHGATLDQLERCKNPFCLASVCRKHAIRFPEVRAAADDKTVLPIEWLIKPLKSAGGSRITVATDASLDRLRPTGRLQKSFLQRRIPGLSFSSVFVAQGAAVRMLGTTRQLVGLPSMTAAPFAYCGSIGPVHLSADCCGELRRVGQCLAESFCLRGVFGLDWIQDRAGRIWLIEINPRLPASAEILELAGICQSVVGMHFGCNTGAKKRRRWTGMVGKAIVFAARDGVVSQTEFRRWVEQWLSSHRRKVGDLPPAGTRLHAGCPMLTVYRHGYRLHTILRGLSQDACHIRDRVFNPPRHVNRRG